MSIPAGSLPAESLRAAVLKALLTEIEASVKGGKAGLKEVMDALDIDALASRLPDGPKVATVRRAGGKASPKVTDPDKFLAWVQENHPSEVVVVPAVRESFQKAGPRRDRQERDPGHGIRRGRPRRRVRHRHGIPHGEFRGRRRGSRQAGVARAPHQP